MTTPKIKQISPQDAAENGMHLMGYKYKVESYTGTFFVLSLFQALKIFVVEIVVEIFNRSAYGKDNKGRYEC